VRSTYNNSTLHSTYT